MSRPKRNKSRRPPKQTKRSAEGTTLAERIAAFYERHRRRRTVLALFAAVAASLFAASFVGLAFPSVVAVAVVFNAAMIVGLYWALTWFVPLAQTSETTQQRMLRAAKQPDMVERDGQGAVSLKRSEDDVVALRGIDLRCWREVVEPTLNEGERPSDA